MSSEEERLARQEKRQYDERYADTDYGGRKALIERQKQAKRALKQAKQRRKAG